MVERPDVSSITQEQLDELAALHAGEEPFEDERLTPTPGQWIWRWNRGTPEQRLLWAGLVVSAIGEAHTCKVLARHEQRIAEQRTEIAQIEAQWAEAAQLSHQYRNAAERAEARIASAHRVVDGFDEYLLRAHAVADLRDALNGAGAEPCAGRECAGSGCSHERAADELVALGQEFERDAN